MKLFVDTSAWAAYYDTSDRWHQAARKALASLIDTRVTFVTTDYVLDETITLLLYHAGRRYALAFGETVQQSRQVQLVQVDASVWTKAWQLFRDYDDKFWAFTDCTSFAIIEKLGIRSVFAFDKDFERMGYTML